MAQIANILFCFCTILLVAPALAMDTSDKHNLGVFGFNSTFGDLTSDPPLYLYGELNFDLGAGYSWPFYDNIT